MNKLDKEQIVRNEIWIKASKEVIENDFKDIKYQRQQVKEMVEENRVLKGRE